jgi:pilus assembly protein Flp/PilA
MMNKLNQRIRRTSAVLNGESSLLRDEKGAGMVEYIMLVGLIAIFAILAFKYFGSSVSTKISQQGDTVNNIQGQ